MKYIYKIWTLLILLPSLSNAQQSPGVINSSDTVFIDLSNAAITGSNIDLPVSIISDDTIFSLDFSFKFNDASLHYDSIIDLTSYLQSFSFYNTNDSTVRYTSSSLLPVSHDTELVYIRFTTLSGPVTFADLHTLKGYLNGNQCSIKWTGIAAFVSDNSGPGIYLCPNPTNGILYINNSTQPGEIQLFDAEGKYIESKNIDKGTQVVDVSYLQPGLYILNFTEGQNRHCSKLVITR